MSKNSLDDANKTGMVDLKAGLMPERIWAQPWIDYPDKSAGGYLVLKATDVDSDDTEYVRADLAASREAAAFRAGTERATLLESAVIAMAEDGWLTCGPEGMSEAQEKCYTAYSAIRAELEGESNSVEIDAIKPAGDWQEAKRRVLARWPEAYCSTQYSAAYPEGKKVVRGMAETKGTGDDEPAAWIDAARRLG
jgi:hypothetical protein